LLIDHIRSTPLNPFSANPQSSKSNVEEGASWLALVPILLTGLFYFLPSSLQHLRLIQFLPQLSAYVALGLWCNRNPAPFTQLGIIPHGLLPSFKWGMFTGLFLGAFNTLIILWAVPKYGVDILFLKETPHATMPTGIMVPWGILGIAIGVELNFRGFLLGRLEALLRPCFRKASPQCLHWASSLAIVGSALVFAFDPFLVTTFQDLHWIAVWDGLVWGVIFVRMRNLLAVVVAHAVEVVILYSCIKVVLT